MGDDSTAADAKLRNQLARLMTLTVFEISKDGGHVEMVEENCSGADDRLLHLFSGPLLGIVKYEASEDGGGAADGGSSKPTTETQHHDSPTSMMRSRRTESSVFAGITTPTFASGGGSGSFSESQSVSEVDTSDLKKTYLEFYEWDSFDKDGQPSSVGGGGGGGLRKIGAPIDCPLALEWERATNRFCALVYPNCVKIYRATATPPDLVCLHEIPTFQTAQSLKWVNHTLFFATEDEIKCCVVSKARCFTFDLASSLLVDETLARPSQDAASRFPRPQVKLLTLVCCQPAGVFTAIRSFVGSQTTYCSECQQAQRQFLVFAASSLCWLVRSSLSTRSVCRTKSCSAASLSRWEKRSTLSSSPRLWMRNSVTGLGRCSKRLDASIKR